MLKEGGRKLSSPSQPVEGCVVFRPCKGVFWGRGKKSLGFYCKETQAASFVRKANDL